MVGIHHSTKWWLRAWSGKIVLIVTYIAHVAPAVWLFYCFSLQQALDVVLDQRQGIQVVMVVIWGPNSRSNTQDSAAVADFQPGGGMRGGARAGSSWKGNVRTVSQSVEGPCHCCSCGVCWDGVGREIKKLHDGQTHFSNHCNYDISVPDIIIQWC